MAEEKPKLESLPPAEKRQRIIDSETKVTFSVSQLLALGSSVVIICGAISFMMYFYFDTKNRMDKAENSLIEINKKLGDAAVSSDKYRKLDSDLHDLKGEIEDLKESNKEIRSKVFK